MTEKYDVKFFEKMPLKVKKEVIDIGEVAWTEDEGRLWDYFNTYRKIAEDEEISLKKV